MLGWQVPALTHQRFCGEHRARVPQEAERPLLLDGYRLRHRKTACARRRRVDELRYYPRCSGVVRQRGQVEGSARQYVHLIVDSASVKDADKTQTVHWHRLDLASCPKLEPLVTNIYFRPSTSKPSNIPALSLATVGMLAQTLATLRRVKICLWDLPRATTLNNRQMLRLHEVDEVITVERFPHLEEIVLQVHPKCRMRMGRAYKWQYIVRGVQRAFPGLHARGVLTVQKY